MPTARETGADPFKLTFKPVTAATREDFIAVFDGPGGPKYCWCMAWRQISGDRQQASNATRKREILERVDAKVPIGLVGYADGDPVGWVSIAPRDTYRPLGGPAPEDGRRSGHLSACTSAAFFAVRVSPIR